MRSGKIIIQGVASSESLFCNHDKTEKEIENPNYLKVINQLLQQITNDMITL